MAEKGPSKGQKSKFRKTKNASDLIKKENNKYQYQGKELYTIQVFLTLKSRSTVIDYIDEKQNLDMRI